MQKKYPGFCLYPRYRFSPYLSLRHHYERLYEVKNGKLNFNENWMPEKPSLKQWVKNLIF